MGDVEVRECILEQLRAEYASGWPLLREVPSTELWRTLGYLNSVSDEDRERYFAAMSERGAKQLSISTPQDFMQLGPSAIMLQLYEQAHARPYFQCMSDRFMRQFSDGTKEGRNFLKQMIDEDRINAVMQCSMPKQAKAGAIRRVLKPLLAKRFGAAATNCGAGNWAYQGTVNGCEFILSLDFGGYHKMRYSVCPGGNKPGWGITWEAALGLGGQGHWDAVFDDAIEESAQQLCEVVIRIQQLWTLASSG